MKIIQELSEVAANPLIQIAVSAVIVAMAIIWQSFTLAYLLLIMALILSTPVVRNKLKQQMQKRKISDAIEGRKNPEVYKMLKYIYRKYRFLSHDRNIPVIVVDLPRNQLREPDSILMKPIIKPSEIDQHLNVAGNEYIEILKESIPKFNEVIHDDPTYRLESIEEDNGSIKINCSLGRYCDALRNCDALEWELFTSARKLPRTKPNYDSFLKRHLPMRSHVHSHSEDPIYKPVGRSTAIGISTLTLFNRGEGYAILFAERSTKHVAVNRDLYHVIPSGMFQPFTNESEEEYFVTHNIYREYLEEIFDLDFRGSRNSSPEVIYDNDNLKFLRELIDKKEAKIYLTGIIVDLLNLRPEICTLLYIKSPDWYKNHKQGGECYYNDKKFNLKGIDFNDEFKKPNEKRSGDMSKIKDKLKSNFVSVNELEKLDLNPNTTTPPGAAAVILGLKVAKELELLP